MMGPPQQRQPKLFCCNVNLEHRVHPDHPLRKVNAAVDFRFVRQEVAPCYGYNGNVSVDPEVILKMQFLLFYDDIPSERELMRMLPVRLDYLWFLGYELDDPVPDHSVLSKARQRWGPAAFESFFVRSVEQCVTAGLVDGRKVHLDGSLVDANASNASVQQGSPALVAALRRACQEQVRKLDEPDEEKDGGHAPAAPEGSDVPQGSAPPEAPQGPQAPAAEETPPDTEGLNPRLLSTTDPDAALTRKGRDGPHLHYKNHRALDDAYGVITATLSTPGKVDESHEMMPLIDQHERTTGTRVETAVADTQYGTVANFLSCEERGIRSHMADLGQVRAADPRREGLFAESDFAYDPATDTYRCPAGQVLRRQRYNRARRAYGYGAAPKACAACPLRPQCTQSNSGRTLQRSEAPEALAAARAHSHSPAARRDRRRRQHLMERSFADASNNHGFKRSRWRRLWRQRIQDCLIAAVQNIRIFLRHGPRRTKGVASAPGALPGTLFCLV